MNTHEDRRRCTGFLPHQAHVSIPESPGCYTNGTCPGALLAVRAQGYKAGIWHRSGRVRTLRFRYLLLGCPDVLWPELVARLLRIISMSCSAVDCPSSRYYNNQSIKSIDSESTSLDVRLGDRDDDHVIYLPKAVWGDETPPVRNSEAIPLACRQEASCASSPRPTEPRYSQTATYRAVPQGRVALTELALQDCLNRRVRARQGC